MNCGWYNAGGIEFLKLSLKNFFPPLMAGSMEITYVYFYHSTYLGSVGEGGVGEGNPQSETE